MKKKPGMENGADTILIVDDTPTNMGMVVESLEGCGYRVVVAQDGEEALQRAEYVLPDLVLLDVMMPGMDGFEVCRRLKAQAFTRDIPVIFMTALADIGSKISGFEAGGVDYVTKPLQIDEIIVRVGTHLKLRAMQKQLESQNAELRNYREHLEQLVAERTVELRESNERLHLSNFALDHVREAAYLMDSELRFRYVNEEACRTLGYSREELSSMSVFDIDPDYTPEAAAARRSNWGIGDIRAHESRHRAKDGRVFPVEIRSTLFEYQGERLIFSLGHDITERKRAERQLWLMDFALDRVREAVYLIDWRTFRFMYVNEEACRVLGYSRSELRTMSVRDIDPDFNDEEVAVFKELEDGDGSLVIERRHRTRAGVVFPVEIHATHFEYEGVPVSIAFAYDITERKDAERRLEESRAQLRALSARRDRAREEERKRIARELHDELGQYLTALSLKVSTLDIQFGAASPKLGEGFQRMSALVDATKQVVRNVAAALRPAALDMGIASAIEWLGDEFCKRSSMACILEVKEDEVFLDDASATVVFRIVQESLTNVARHAKASNVKIRLERRGDHYVLEVRDDGKGFDPAIQRKKTFGLVGMRERLLAVGGDFTVASAPGQGTAIIARIPVEESRSKE